MVPHTEKMRGKGSIYFYSQSPFRFNLHFMMSSNADTPDEERNPRPTVMVDFPAYFPYFSNKGFTIFFWATICKEQDKHKTLAFSPERRRAVYRESLTPAVKLRFIASAATQ